jgi:hypothetical protein
VRVRRKEQEQPVIQFAIESRWVNTDLRSTEYEWIHVSARIVIGLLQSTTLGVDGIADFLKVPPEEIQRFVAELRGHRLCATMLESGFPATYGARLPYGLTVVCKDCRNTIDFVPCLMCCSCGGNSDDNRHEPDWPDCNQPVHCEPGSDEKIEVMRSRVSQGFSPFCSGDKLSRCQNRPPHPSPVDRTQIEYDRFMERNVRRGC